jgi:hypothetical protein
VNHDLPCYSVNCVSTDPSLASALAPSNIWIMNRRRKLSLVAIASVPGFFSEATGNHVRIL